jgi:hypothetical protein
MSNVPVCPLCARTMDLLDEEAGRWYCHKDDQLFFAKQNVWKPEMTADRLENARELLRQKREKQIELGQVIIVTLTKQAEVRREWTAKEVSNANQLGKSIGDLGGFLGGGPIGLVGLKGLEAVFGKKTATKIERRIREKPHLYPYSRIDFHMLCPKCLLEVRADQQFCGSCGTKYEIPIPEYVWL